MLLLVVKQKEQLHLLSLVGTACSAHFQQQCSDCGCRSPPAAALHILHGKLGGKATQCVLTPQVIKQIPTPATSI